MTCDTRQPCDNCGRSCRGLFCSSWCEQAMEDYLDWQENHPGKQDDEQVSESLNIAYGVCTNDDIRSSLDS